MDIHPETPERFRKLPKFLVADSGGEREQAVRFFVVHCHYPRFLIEFAPTVGEDFQATWIDDPMPFLDGEIQQRNNPDAMNALIREACEFYKAETEQG